jgi:DnaK suppressor protein
MAQKTSPKKHSKSASTKKTAAPTVIRKAPTISTKRRPEPAKNKGRSKPETPAKSAGKKSATAELPVKKEKVPTNLAKSDLQYFRNLLLEKRREILGDVGSMEMEAFKSGSNLSNMPIHMADVGTDNFEQEFTLGLIESERQILREIQEALIRVDEGTFGICQGTGKPIPRVRLEAVPWAKYRIEYSRLLESGKIGREEGGSSDDDSGEEDEE